MIFVTEQGQADAAKASAYEAQGMTDGPGPRDVPEPGQLSPHDYRRGLLTEGLAAASPGHELPDCPVPVLPPGTATADGAAAWAAAGARTPNASTTPAPSAVAAYRPARPRIEKTACVFMEPPRLAATDRSGPGQPPDTTRGPDCPDSTWPARICTERVLRIDPMSAPLVRRPAQVAEQQTQPAPGRSRTAGAGGPRRAPQMWADRPHSRRDAGHIGPGMGRLSGGRGDWVDAGAVVAPEGRRGSAGPDGGGDVVHLRRPAADQHRLDVTVVQDDIAAVAVQSPGVFRECRFLSYSRRCRRRASAGVVWSRRPSGTCR
jgi:hypothetical protein